MKIPFRNEGKMKTLKAQMILEVRKSPNKAGDIRDVSSIPGWGRSPGGRHGNPL